MDYDKEDYQQFIGYIKSTWSSLFDDDWINEPQINDIIIDLYKNEFRVFVSLKDNTYYRFVDGELITENYSSKEYIKTTYYRNDEALLYMLINGDIINDLGLKDVKIFINPCYVDCIPVHKYLSKELEGFEESFAEALYCALHDL